MSRKYYLHKYQEYLANLLGKNVMPVFDLTIDMEKIDCLRFVMCPLLALPHPRLFSFFFAVAIYSTNETNKAGGMCH